MLLVLLSANLHSDLGPYIYKYSKYPSHSNNGTIGLIQMPSARFMPEGSVAFNLSNVDPYQRGSIIGTPFNWFEASYQYTDVDNALYSLSPEFSGDQTYKDKSFDAKFLLLKESNYFPAIAFGARDLAGTGVFSAEYLVASKRLNNFDFTLGIGWGTFSDHGIKNPFRYIDDEFETRDVSSNETQGGEFSIGNYLSGKDVGIFGGVEVYLPNFRGARFKVEYDSTDYEKEGFPFGKQSFNFAFKNVRQPSSKVNFGVVYPISDNFHLKLFHVKGHTLSFGFSFQGDFGKKTPLIKKKDSHIEVPDKEIYKIVTTRSDENLYKASLLHLNPRELKLQTAQVTDDTLKVAYSQSKHASWMRSTGRVLRVIDEIAPEKIKTIEVGNVNGGLGMFKMKIDRDDFSQNLNSNTPLVALKDAEITPFNYVREDYDFTPRVEFPQLFWSIVPTLRMQIGGPDGFFFGNVRLSGKAELSLARNISVKASASYGLTDNFEDLKLLSDSVLPHVRTDIVSYLREGRGLTLDTLQVDRFFKFGDDFYAKLTAGYVENMHAAVGGEVLYRPFFRNFAIGAEAWQTKQRAYDMGFGFLDYETVTGFINLYYKEPKTQVLFAIRGGRFLAKDSGINFDFSRRFKSGAKMGVFFSLTDISEFEFGEGSFDKGFYFFIPVESFFDKYSKGSVGLGLRPLTRDGAASLKHTHTLYGVTEQGQFININRDWDDLYD